MESRLFVVVVHSGLVSENKNSLQIVIPSAVVNAASVPHILQICNLHFKSAFLHTATHSSHNSLILSDIITYIVYFMCLLFLLKWVL